ncbi:MAG: sigma 54-interacting transcriptional regulator [Tissierellia bacterium]|nr:sigma 54-interacting transcriptional regulator [Tissierellia bacterium]
MLGIYDYEKVVIQSHKRCIGYNIKNSMPSPKIILKDKELKTLLEENDQLIKIARPFMKILYDFLSGSGFSIYLTDREGRVLTIIGDQDIVNDQSKAGITIGSDMSEESAGTNAIGTAIFEDHSIQLSGEDHFITAFHIWTCSADVIHDEYDNIIGCLNLTGRHQLAHPHTLGLVVAAGRSIENQIQIEIAQNELFKANKYLHTVMDSINLGIITTDIQGMVIAINSSLCRMLDITPNEMINTNIDSILGNWNYILNGLTKGDSYENREIIYSRDEKKIRFDISIYPIKGHVDEITGTVIIFKDMQNVYDMVSKYTGMSATYNFIDIIGESEKILKLKKQAKSISDSPSTVLIQGESGTGKELIAQSIHNNSSRKNNSFVAINCGAIPKSLIASELFGYEGGAFTGAKKEGHLGKFELASGGTLFLDEIGEMPLDMQVSLLRVLQEGSVTRLGGTKRTVTDVRIIASTNKDLKKEVDKGTFRKDLYYRLSVIPIYVPPLREREGDIGLLIEHFLKVKSMELMKPIKPIRADIYARLINHSWPGNVREMENCIENIVNMGGDTSFSLDDSTPVDKQYTNSVSAPEYNMCSLKEWEQKAILDCLNKCKGNITKAAKILGINRSTLHYKINNYKKSST